MLAKTTVRTEKPRALPRHASQISLTKKFSHLNIFVLSVHNNIDVFSLPYFFIANSPEATASGLFAFAPRLLRSQKKLLKLY